MTGFSPLTPSPDMGAWARRHIPHLILRRGCVGEAVQLLRNLSLKAPLLRLPGRLVLRLPEAVLMRVPRRLRHRLKVLRCSRADVAWEAGCLNRGKPILVWRWAFPKDAL